MRDRPEIKTSPSRWHAVLHGLCPRCLQGKIYRTAFKMNDTCPACHLKFEREQGYFLGAMGVSYLLGVPILFAILALLSVTLFPAWPEYLVLAPAMVFYLPLIPLICRQARIIWIHFDRLADPEKPNSIEEQTNMAP